ncbi:hypothetical protein COOONC_07068, partial [Cooperia oncophora]
MSEKSPAVCLAVWSYLLVCASSVLYDRPYIPTTPPIPVVPRSPKPNDKLHLVQVVWRHGDRAPTMTYPTDVHQEDAWPYGWGELTEVNSSKEFIEEK